MQRRSHTSSAGTTPAATAPATPEAIPACAAPNVRLTCDSFPIVVLLTNSVKGRAGTPGRTTATKGVWPIRGVARAVVQAVSTGPPLRPMTTLTCAAFTPSPTKDSPIKLPAANVTMTHLLSENEAPDRSSYARRLPASSPLIRRSQADMVPEEACGVRRLTTKKVTRLARRPP